MGYIQILSNMKKLYLLGLLQIGFFIISFIPKISLAQSCSTLTATYQATESRCEATGSILIDATGGSGNYQYKATGPVTTSYTSSNLITGLAAGNYLITIKDVVTNCIYANDSVTVTGDYVAPNFTMVTTDVTCLNGSDGTITVDSLYYGRAPYSFKIIAPSASGEGTVSATGVFTGLISGNYLIQLSDSCGAIQTRSAIILNYDWYIYNYPVTKIGCDSISVTINLRDNRGNATPDSIFNGFLYGASILPGDTTWFSSNTFTYYIGNKHSAEFFVKDKCGNIKSVLWVDQLIPNVDASVLISNKACSTFTATITGQVNLTSPGFCLYDSASVLITCNTTGVFDLLPYGNYCIEIKDTCYDTTITRCFRMMIPLPEVDARVAIRTACNDFTATVTGQLNLSNPYYCLYDSSNVLMYCDSTGVFSNLPYGSYCIRIFNDPVCFDTTITRCFTVNRPIPAAGPDVDISNLGCTTFTVTISDTSDLNNPKFCLYTPARVLIMCNTTGVFDSIPYGTYCIEIENDPGCYDTTIIRCFTVNPPIPSVNANVDISNQTCYSFTARVTGQTNIFNAKYCLYNSLNVLLGCNDTGVFPNLQFGSYCIQVRNSAACYDTTINLCFVQRAPVVDFSLSANQSCSILGTSNLGVTITAGNPAYIISLYGPTGVLLQTLTTSSNNHTFTNLPNLPAPLKYLVEVKDICDNIDTLSIQPNVSVVNRLITITPKCPSGIWPNGSSDVLVNISDNNIGGDIIPKIIKKDGVPVDIPASTISGYKFNFLDLGPGVYIFDTYINDCNKHVYDTVAVRIYLFPILSGTNAYQCDNNGFSVSVNVVGGIRPYTYEIIGSVPASPSIVTAPQGSPIFSVNNGTTYSLIRLRVIDACGNASLYDVSVLPLSNFLVFADTLECFNHRLTLRVDSIANAQYTWYKRIDPNDSTIVGTGPSLQFPVLLPSDTGRYFCKIVVNNGCLTRIANYVLTGQCMGILPVDVSLQGTKINSGIKLYWDKGTPDISEYSLQRSTGSSTHFKNIYTTGNGTNTVNSFIDIDPLTDINYYRLKLTSVNNTVKYTNIVVIKNKESEIYIYPNPVQDVLYISIKNNKPKNYAIELTSMLGQKLISEKYYNVRSSVIDLTRKTNLKPGVYSVAVIDLVTNERHTYKVIYK